MIAAQLRRTRVLKVILMSNVMIKFSRVWEMPNGRTFEMKHAKEIIVRYLNGLSVDPFANKSKLASVNNDIDISCNPDTCMSANDFLKTFQEGSVDVVLFDPPYSPRQVSECYKSLGLSVNKETTQSSFWSKIKDTAAVIIRPGGLVISFGWNSNGLGKKRGFEVVEIKLIHHGAAHNDTIVTVEKKMIGKPNVQVSDTRDDAMKNRPLAQQNNKPL